MIARRITGAARWAWAEARERFDPVGTVRKIWALAATHGMRFVVAALIWEFIESVVAPIVAWRYGHPELIPVFIIFHAEPIVWPIFMYTFRTYDRIRGRIPWEPPRSTASLARRSGVKVAIYRAVTIAVFWAVLAHLRISFGVLTAYAIAMTVFAYVHERIWHDSGWGITPADAVLRRRTVAKALTYRATSVFVMAGAFKALLAITPWGAIAVYQSIALCVYAGLEAGWARTAWGLRAGGAG